MPINDFPERLGPVFDNLSDYAKMLVKIMENM
jgi:hypothetical protein